jgi:DNA modification methylase
MATPTERHTVYRSLDMLLRAQATRNPKRHALDKIVNSISRFGFTQPLLHDERTGRLAAGHGRLAALQRMRTGGEDAPDGVRVDDDGGWLVPVTAGWASRSDAEADAYLVADNKLTELGGWDNAMLGELLAELAEQDEALLAAAGYDLTELDAILNDLDLPTGPAAGAVSVHDDGDYRVPLNGDPDDAPPAPDVAVTATGDVWLLGPHRVVCGDSTMASDLQRLMQGQIADCVFTDPPYNADYSSRVDANRRKPWGGIANDNMTPEAFDVFLTDVHASLWQHVKDEGSVYVWTDWKRYPQVARVFSEAFTHKGMIVWDKGHFGLGTYYRTQHELALFGVKGARVGTWNAGHDERDVWAVSRDPVGSYVHPTQKPVTLAERGITNSSQPGDVILDLFGGSGSTLIAAHRTGRIARLMELDPKYVDVICRRYQQLTGDTPVLESTGEPHDFTTAD